jgi:hypothetical protein
VAKRLHRRADRCSWMPDLMPQEVAAMLQGYTPHFERIPKAPKAELTAPTVRFLRARARHGVPSISAAQLQHTRSKQTAVSSGTA